MPRSYRLGARAMQKAATRQRIVDAAAALYQERGVSNTTVPEVARRADVAPGTVLNHFASPDALAQAVIDDLVGSLQLPTADMLLGIDTVVGRIGQLTRLLFAFYERSNSWYQVYAREPDIPAWANAEAAFYRDYDRLIRSALGEAATDSSVAIVTGVLGGGLYATLRAPGISSEVAADLIIELLTPWLRRLKVANRSPG